MPLFQSTKSTPKTRPYLKGLGLYIETTELVLYCLDWGVGHEWIFGSCEYVERPLAEAESEPEKPAEPIRSLIGITKNDQRQKGALG